MSRRQRAGHRDRRLAMSAGVTNPRAGESSATFDCQGKYSRATLGRLNKRSRLSQNRAALQYYTPPSLTATSVRFLADSFFMILRT